MPRLLVFILGIRLLHVNKNGHIFAVLAGVIFFLLYPCVLFVICFGVLYFAWRAFSGTLCYALSTNLLKVYLGVHVALCDDKVLLTVVEDLPRLASV